MEAFRLQFNGFHPSDFTWYAATRVKNAAICIESSAMERHSFVSDTYSNIRSYKIWRGEGWVKCSPVIKQYEQDAEDEAIPGPK
jgi:hypothetical protein